MLPNSPPVFVLGGRAGDSIQLLPCFKAILDRTGFKPVVICSNVYASVYEGVSYVQAQPVRCDWWQGVPTMKKIAQECFGGGTVVQFWQEPPKHDDTIGFRGRNWTTLQSHGHEHGVNMDFDPDYGTSMARRCGFTRDEWLSLPLVFDRRNSVRETELARKAFPRQPPKPILLYHFAGISSPFGFVPEVYNTLLKYRAWFHLVDLGSIKAQRIYDLLGLMDRAKGMILSDSAPMHLALATQTPYVGYTVDSWCTSVPKGPCVLHVKYNETPRRLAELEQVIESWKNT